MQSLPLRHIAESPSLAHRWRLATYKYRQAAASGMPMSLHSPKQQ
jgi:hypothetical protein